MRNIIGSTIIVATLCSAAYAADVPVRGAAPAPLVYAAPVFTWAGVYVGVHGGYAWGKLEGSSYELDTNEFNRTVDRKQNGGFGGAQIGYNFQFSPAWMVGVEADVSVGDLKGSQTFTNDAGTQISTVSSGNIPMFGTLRLRTGFTFDQVLIYATGGLAWAKTEGRRVQYATTLAGNVAPAFSTVPVFVDPTDNTRTGWVLGAGVEWAFAQNWSAKLEYLYASFGDHTTYNPRALSTVFGYPNQPANGRYSITELTVQSVRVGLNYRFGATSAARPVVAAY